MLSNAGLVLSFFFKFSIQTIILVAKCYSLFTVLRGFSEYLVVTETSYLRFYHFEIGKGLNFFQ